jgi:hypothetical protein
MPELAYFGQNVVAAYGIGIHAQPLTNQGSDEKSEQGFLWHFADNLKHGGFL